MAQIIAFPVGGRRNIERRPLDGLVEQARQLAARYADPDAVTAGEVNRMLLRLHQVPVHSLRRHRRQVVEALSVLGDDLARRIIAWEAAKSDDENTKAFWVEMSTCFAATVAR